MTNTAVNEEIAVLLGTLEHQWDHVLRILEGRSEGDLRHPILPSGWTCLGPVRHGALDVARFRLSRVVVVTLGSSFPARSAQRIGSPTCLAGG